MGLAVKGLNRWKFATVTLCLVVALLVSCFVVLYQPIFEVEAKEPVLLNVSIDGPAKIGANAPTDYVARVFGGEGDLTYAWSISPDDSNVMLEPDGGVCVLTFTTATEAPYTLEVTVHDAAGNFGVASMAVYDPPTYPNYYLGVSTAPYSYMIKTDNTGWYYAVNGSDGSVSWPSSDADTIFDNVALAVQTTGGDIKVGVGNFPNVNLTLAGGSKTISLVGSGLDNTILTGKAGSPVITVGTGSNVAHVVISDLSVNGADLATYGINAKSYQSTYQNIRIENCTTDGFLLDGNSVPNSGNSNILTNLLVGANSQDGLSLGQLSYDNTITACQFYANGQDGLNLNNSPNNKFIACFSFGNALRGVYFTGYGCIGSELFSCDINDNGAEGVLFETVKEVKIYGGRINDNSEAAAGSYAAIQLDGSVSFRTSEILINKVLFYGESNKYFVSSNGFNSLIYITENDFASSADTDYIFNITSGWGCIVKDNINYNFAVTEYDSGTATITTGNTYVDVAYSLPSGRTATSCGMTPTSLGYGTGCGAYVVNATHIRVFVQDSSFNSNVNWWVWGEP